MEQPSAAGRVVVVGGSAGSIEPLRTILGGLPPDFPAALLVVVHGSSGTGSLPRVLATAGSLPAEFAADGTAIRPGRVFVGVPDRHLILQDGVMRLSPGARVNHARPAVDPLFQSAALAHGPGVIGVVLSGSLDDGSAGLAAIRRHGGIAIVQDPDEATFSGMPRSAAVHADPAHVLPAGEIPDLLVRIVSAAPTDRDGALAFRCRIGHSYTARHLLDAQGDEVENGLWQAFRALEEQAELARTLGNTARIEGRTSAANRFDEQERVARKRAEMIRAILEQAACVAAAASRDLRQGGNGEWHLTIARAQCRPRGSSSWTTTRRPSTSCTRS